MKKAIKRLGLVKTNRTIDDMFTKDIHCYQDPKTKIYFMQYDPYSKKDLRPKKAVYYFFIVADVIKFEGFASVQFLKKAVDPIKCILRE